MGDRTIAEIIGLEFYPWNGPTADDLLAWLLRAGDTQDGVDFAAYWSTENVEYFPARTYSVHIGVCDEDGDRHERSASGPTLLAALEAAVRAVDQSSLASAPPHEVEAPVVAATGDNANPPSL